jgi:hypothetical protein
MTMGLIWEVKNLFLFLTFFIPGFISIKTHDLLVPAPRRDFTKSLLEVIGYSSLNFALFSWLIIIIFSRGFYREHEHLFLFSMILIMFVGPAFWPLGLRWLSKRRFIAKYILDPSPTPWDYVFGKKESLWAIVHLKDGRRIGGKYDTKSFASAYPEEEQIFLEEVWEIDNVGKFVRPINGSRGIIFVRGNITAVEFFE